MVQGTKAHEPEVPMIVWEAPANNQQRSSDYFTHPLVDSLQTHPGIKPPTHVFYSRL